MPQLNPPTPAEIMALITADYSRPAGIGAIDAAWIQNDIDNRGLSSVVTLEYSKMQETLSLAGLSYQTLTNVQWGAANNALIFSIIYQLRIRDFELRSLQSQITEPREMFESNLALLKDGICRNLNQISVFSEEYCGTGYEKIKSLVLTPEDL